MAQSTKPKRFRVVVAFDFSEAAELGLERGVAVAQGHPHADLHVIGVLDEHRGLGSVRPRHRSDYSASEQVEAEINELVDARIEKPTPNDLHLYVHARIGDAATHILALASEVMADVVILGTHGRRGIRRWLMGSVAETVVRHARCPVLVVRPAGYEESEALPQFGPEPPCPECVATREATSGEQWWCEVHARPRQRAHHYSYDSPTAVDTSDHSNSILW